MPAYYFFFNGYLVLAGNWKDRDPSHGDLPWLGAALPGPGLGLGGLDGYWTSLPVDGVHREDAMAGEGWLGGEIWWLSGYIRRGCLVVN